MRDGYVTLAAAALGVGAVAAHHASEGTVDATVIALAKSETARGIAFGAGGGAAVGIVTKASVVELIGRTFVGGLMAAVAAPWIAESILHVPTSSTAYPVLCCSIGVLGYQMVQQIIKDPGSLPVIGKVLGSFTGNQQGSSQTAGSGSPPPMPPQVAPTPPAANVGAPRDIPVTDWQPKPDRSQRQIRVPLARG